MIWRRRKHGDTTVFPVSDAIYRGNKNPRYGTANPERSDNPFWFEMARRRWPPSRARLHFGDFAPPQPEFVLSDDDPAAGAPESGRQSRRPDGAPVSADIERSKLVRTIDDVIWTAVREGALKMALPDGRRLLIGGEVPDYGDECADPWVYNDVIVTHPDGAIEILIYPRTIFPHLDLSRRALWPGCLCLRHH